MLHLIHLNLNSILLVRFVGGFSKYITLHNCFLLPFEWMETYFAFCGIWGMFCFLFLSAFHEGECTRIFTMVHAGAPRSLVFSHSTTISLHGLERRELPSQQVILGNFRQWKRRTGTGEGKSVLATEGRKRPYNRVPLLKEEEEREAERKGSTFWGRWDPNILERAMRRSDLWWQL